MHSEGFSVFSTTADVGMTVFGKDLHELFFHALKGINYLLFGHHLPSQEENKQKIVPFHFRGDSCENVLHNFLSEILFLVYARAKMTIEMQIHCLQPSFLQCDLIIIPLERLPEIEIKSVTYHCLKVTETTEGKVVDVIFDI